MEKSNAVVKEEEQKESNNEWRGGSTATNQI